MRFTAMPSTYPREGIYEYSTVHVDLACATCGAQIHYTIDGSAPTAQSPVYDRTKGLIPLFAKPDVETVYNIRAVAYAKGLEPSPEASYTFRIIGRKTGCYPHQIMREPSENTLGLIRIEDYDLDKMFLLTGSERAVLIDAGYDYKGNLYDLCVKLSGGLPVDLVVAHGHPDHIAQIPVFLAAGARVYMPHADMSLAASFNSDLTCENILDIKTGDVLDLGNGSLTVYTVSGHTPGGIVLIDESTGDLFASDEFGSNRRYVPDSAFLQLSDCSAEGCLNELRAFRKAAGDKVKRIYTGHNDDILDANTYLDCLERALVKSVEQGAASLVPSLRSKEESFGSGTILSDGDWRYDPMWIAANISFLTEADRLSDPPAYAPGFTYSENPLEQLK